MLQSHAVDARGLCCESESIDSCGVCDGDHSSCDTVIHVAVTFSDPVEERAVEASVLEHVSSTLAIPAGGTPLDTSPSAVLLSLDAGGQCSFSFLPPVTFKLVHLLNGPKCYAVVHRSVLLF